MPTTADQPAESRRTREWKATNRNLDVGVFYAVLSVTGGAKVSLKLNLP